MKNKEDPFELISDEEALEISKKAKEKKPFKLFSIKTLIILVAIFAILTVVNSLLENRNTEKPTMDIIYENLEKSMSEEDIMQIIELTSKAVQLLPKDEQEKLIELQTLFGEKGYSALTANETKVMTDLNNKAISLLPNDDRIKLDALMKKMYDSMTR